MVLITALAAAGYAMENANTIPIVKPFQTPELGLSIF